MNLLADLRLAARRLLAAPGFALTAIVTLGTAVAANSAIFSAVHAVLLAPTPVADPGRIVVAWQTEAANQQAVVELTYRHLREWRLAGGVFTAASAMGSHNWDVILEGEGEPTRLWLSGVTWDFFETLGVRPLLGRTFRADDDLPNAPSVAILNHGAWLRRFGGDPNIVGRTVQLDGGPVEVVGVMPPGMDVPRGAELWAPVVPILTGGNPANLPGLDTIGLLYVVGRLRPGLDADAARAQLDLVEAGLDRTITGRPKWGDRSVVRTLDDVQFGPMRPALWWLWGAVTVLLLIACANISGLLLTRMSVRHREHGVRLALGASRGAIGRLWLGEVFLIALVGGALGLAAASWMLRAILALAPGDLLHAETIDIDATVATFTLVLVAGAALLAGLLPLGQLGRTNMVDALTAGARSTAGRISMRWRSALVMVQVALAVVLLVGAGLLARSFVHLRQIDLGFTSDHVVTMVVQPRSAQGPPNEWFRELLARVERLPDVSAAGAVYLRPLALGPIGQGVLFTLEGQPETPQAAQGNPTLNHQIATPGYFEAMRIRVLRGRGFTDADAASSPRVALVSESTARTLWPGQDAVGRRIRMSSFVPGSGPSWREVVGVVSDVRYRGLTDVHLDVYDPARQVGRPATNLVVRTTGDTAALVAAVREHAQRLDPTAIVDDVSTLDSIVSRASAAWRMSMWLFAAFAAMAFALSALGLFGLVALDVTHRAQEFAVRLALGSSPAALVRRVVGQAWLRAGAGMAAGLGVATLGATAMQSLLYEVRPIDAATYAAVTGLVAIVVTIAASLPARRAARATPQSLFRSGD